MILATATPSWATDWTGSTSTDWFAAGNWSAGAPSAGTDTVLDTITPNATVIGAAGAQAGVLSVGYYSTGTLTIQGGGQLTNTFGYIGADTTSTGAVTVNGAGSTWTNTSALTVGLFGLGTLTIQNGGKVSNTNGVIGSNSTAANTVTVDGAGSLWSNSGSLTVGDRGVGNLIIQNGGQVTNTVGNIGANFGATGVVTVDGAGSTWANTGALNVGLGGHGTGTLTIQNGGKVSNANGVIGVQADAIGTVTVDGAGSTWTNAGSLTVGDSGKGTLTIQNGGQVSNNIGYVGNNAGVTGTVIVNGVGSTWTNAGALFVGVYGAGSLTIQNGGKVSNTDAYLASFADSIAPVRVAGAGSTWANSGNLFVGYGGSASLSIENGGKISNVGGLIGINVGATGTVAVDGAGSTWTNSGGVVVGAVGTGTLTIQNKGSVAGATGDIANDSRATGKVIVDGAGSSWTNSGDLNVGTFGAGTLTIQNGGKVSNAVGAVGYFAGSTGAVTVDGVGSSWTNTNSLYVGKSGTGTLAIQNGGAVSNFAGYIGDKANSVGTVTVNGPGSSWVNSSNLTVGNAGAGTLNIQSDGKVSNTFGFIGFAAGSTGTVTVDGAGSTWTNSGELRVGDSGAGALTIRNGGTVSAANVQIARVAGSTGALNIGVEIGQAAAAPGALTAPSIAFGAGTGTIVFNHTAASYTFAPVLSGMGSLYVEAGTTILTAASDGFTGPTIVDGGKLIVNGSIASSFTTVNGGTLGGNGTVGTLVVNAGGIIAPGNSIGTLNVAGNLTFNSGSVYQVELNATGQYDRINVSGTATINGGIVQVVSAPGVYTVGGHYAIVTAAGGVSGTYAALTQTAPMPFLSFALNYDSSNVYLDVSRSNMSFASVGLTPNQTAVGGSLDNITLTNPIVKALVQLDAASSRAAYDQLSGEMHASALTALIEDSRFVRNGAIDRLRGAFDAPGAPAMPVMSYVPGGPTMVRGAPQERFAIWAQAYGSWGHWNGNGATAKLSRSIGGFTVGIDTLAFADWRIGLLAGYSSTGIGARASSGNSDNYHLGAYAGTQWGPVGFRAGLIETWHDLRTTRMVAFPGFSDLLRGNYRGNTTQVFGDIGYRLNYGRMAFEPFANLAYMHLRTEGFREIGGPGALTSPGATSSTTSTTLGLRASTLFDLAGYQVTARGTLGWRHAFGAVIPRSLVAFAGDTPFGIEGTAIARNAAVIEAGLDVQITPSATLGISYTGQFARTANDQSLKGTFNWKF